MSHSPGPEKQQSPERNYPVSMLGLVGLGIMLMLGCERSDSRSGTPITADDTAATQPAEARPTTQMLLSGPYKKLLLPGMPLSLRVPESWKIDYAGPITFVQGPTPYDMAMIQLSDHGVGPRSLDPQVLLKTIQDEQARHPDPRNRAMLRDIGPARVLERFSVGKPQTNPKVDAHGVPVSDPATGNPVMLTTTPIRWTLTVFVPAADSAYTRYELNFLDLTAEQYAVDGKFLEKIASSLSYEAQTGGEAPMQATTSPGQFP
ncbi:hypothetical protein [Fontivita pretiosa]|jgi:hypothetical protein|uniref:hypothetical protein n=1 Tax=Fontivita pretiosa TaxID=2989684 RepID=UPI003D16896C